MNTYFIASLLVFWLIYLLVLKVFGKRKNGYSIIVSFLFIAGFAYFYFEEGLDSEYYIYYYYGTISFFILYITVINLMKVFKKSISEYDFYELEKELEELSNNSELLRIRFISTIELLNDGISFRDHDGSIFGSDKYVEIVGVKDNQFTQEEFEKQIYKDDLYQYRNVLEKTSKRNPIYSVKYRVKKDDEYEWLNEVGKRIILNKKISYISIVKPINIRKFPESEIDVLNNLSTFKKMYDEMTKLNKQKKPYHLLKIRLTNIPKINEKYGREVGDLMMGEYLKRLQYNFIKDSTSLFRLGGIDFGLLIKDERKYEIMERALSGAGDLLNLSMVFGGITQTLYPNIGISESPYLGKSPDKVVEEADQALKITLKDQSDKNYCFFNRI